MPPSRPGGSALGGAGVGSGSSSKYFPPSAGSASGGSSGRPPILLMAFLVVNCLVPIASLFLYGFRGDMGRHAIGVLFGMFVSVILLGVFRQSLNKRRGDGRFSDWRVSSTKLSTVVSLVAWLSGMINLFVVCLEYSRGFT